MTDALSGAATSPLAPLMTSQPSAAGVERKDQFGKDTFLQLLVAQLRYQDPTNPTDGAEFLSQTAQFSVVEKLEELTKTNTDLLASSLDMTATSLVGRNITYTNAEGTEATGVVTAARFGPLGPVLRVGSDEIQLGSVTQINAAPPAPAAPQQA